MRRGILAGEFMMDTFLAGWSTLITLATPRKVSTENFRHEETSQKSFENGQSKTKYANQSKVKERR
jgi:hypothetical protein